MTCWTPSNSTNRFSSITIQEGSNSTRKKHEFFGGVAINKFQHFVSPTIRSIFLLRVDTRDDDMAFGLFSQFGPSRLTMFNPAFNLFNRSAHVELVHSTLPLKLNLRLWCVSYNRFYLLAFPCVFMPWTRSSSSLVPCPTTPLVQCSLTRSVPRSSTFLVNLSAQEPYLVRLQHFSTHWLLQVGVDFCLSD